MLYPLINHNTKMKYILSTGRGTTRVEEYLIDLFKLHLKIYPGDIPGALDYGFDFNLQGIYQNELPAELSRRIGSLVQKINSRFSSDYIQMSIESLELISETRARVVIAAGNLRDDIEINIL